jgi:tetratricopeptide (TPR) repeat protein
MKEPKIALAMIVKGSDSEAELLDRCLSNVSPHIDGVFITSTYKKGEQPNNAVRLVAELYDAEISTFEWINDFGAARNFNFSQVTKDYDYILWCDADDVWRGLEKLKPTLAENPKLDIMAFWYLYDFDEYKQPTVVHKKSMVCRNDGCVSWSGKLHEDFAENRQCVVKFVEGIERMHLTNDERVIQAQERNIEVSQGDLNENPNDPRTYWNLANSYLGANKYEDAKRTFEVFIDKSQSHEEKYLAQMRLGVILDSMGQRKDGIKALQIAIGMRPDYPDAYLHIGEIMFKYDNLDLAEFYLLNGLMKKPPYHSIMVYNPRDYDYNPMMLLAKVYLKKYRPDLAVPMLEGCMKIYPDNKNVGKLLEEMKKEKDRMIKVLKILEDLSTETDKDKIKAELKKVPSDLKAHPAVCNFRNNHFIKSESSGKDLVYYCGMTTHIWNPELFKTKGFGGSEEAVYNLAKEWAKKGWNVTVYNACGDEEMTVDGVTYRPFWEWNYKDKQDITILWRHPRPIDYDINSAKIFVDLHDVVPPMEFTESRLSKIDSVFVKTKFHRSLFPNIPDNKITVVPNGQNLYNVVEEKDKYLIVNTSSPDRSMGVVPELFTRIKEQVPEAKMEWAYGWENFKNYYEHDDEKMAWMEKIDKEMKDSGIVDRGRVTQEEVARMYARAHVMLYPTEFAEIDCITVKKAQAVGCVPVTTDFGALDESVQWGVKIHSSKTKDNWSAPYQFSFGVTDEKMKQELVDAVVKTLKQDVRENTGIMKLWAEQYDWDKISNLWEKKF